MKKLIFDFFPLVIFFVAFKLYNIYVATGALMVASSIQIIYEYVKYKKIEPMHIITLVLVIIFGGLTIYFHNDRFIQWKVSILKLALRRDFFSFTIIHEKADYPTTNGEKCPVT